jgi:inner membrane protein YidH
MSDTPEPNARDYLAQERTLLAWIRTGVGLVGFGFVVSACGCCRCRG